MSFPNDGRNHKNAIKNEESTKSFLEIYGHEIFPDVNKGEYVVEGRGGTKYKADNVIITDDGITINISDKEKRKGLGGSFDYTNTSAAIKEMINMGEDNSFLMKKVINESKKDRNLSLDKRKKLVDDYRDKVKKASYEAIKKMTSKQITSLLKTYLIKSNRDMYMFITDGVTNKRYIFPFINHPVNLLLKKGYVPSIQVKLGKSSGRVLFTKGDDVQNVGLRMRIHTNNGVSALLGLSKSNKNAAFVLKFQQDGIPKLIESVDRIEI
jgi:hypothetical protein